jgi:hypothetical protein
MENSPQITTYMFTSYDKALEQFPECYVRLFYERPGEKERFKDSEYYETELGRFNLIRDLLSDWWKYGIWIKSVTGFYTEVISNDFLFQNWEIMIIIELGPSMGDTASVKNIMDLDITNSKAYYAPLYDGLGNAECQLDFIVTGQDSVKIVINESY